MRCHITLVFALLGLSSASPSYMVERGNSVSSPNAGQCTGEIIGYRTVSTQQIADTINNGKGHAFPKTKPNGSDLGDDSVYFSNGFGDYEGGGSGVHWCVAYANQEALQKASKVWVPDNKVCPNIRFNDKLIDSYILLVSQNKYTPSSTLRFAPYDDGVSKYTQMAVPFNLLDTMKMCGVCFPKAEAMTMKAKYPRVDYQAGDFLKTANGKVTKRGGVTCPKSA